MTNIEIFGIPSYTILTVLASIVLVLSAIELFRGIKQEAEAEERGETISFLGYIELILKYMKMMVLAFFAGEKEEKGDNTDSVLWYITIGILLLLFILTRIM